MGLLNTKRLRSHISLIYILALLALHGCSEEDIPVINKSNRYAQCDSKLVACAGNQVGKYCLFGYKWGEDQNFDETGIEAIGPQTSGGIITFSFQQKNGTTNTHRQINIPSESWGEILPCAKKQIRAAILAWEEVADITFQELPENSESDIQFYVAAILQSAVGYPNYPETPCDILSGDVILDANSNEKSCKGYYINALHEIGHVLGLGHVDSNNIMETGTAKFSLDGLQNGDIAGVREIYGGK